MNSEGRHMFRRPHTRVQGVGADVQVSGYATGKGAFIPT